MNRGLLLVAVALFAISCTTKQKQEIETKNTEIATLSLTIKEAKKIIELPLHCIEQEYPNKLGQVLGQDNDLKTPKQLRPIFYGCFDWHSSVHGFWSIITLLKEFPELDKDNQIRQQLNQLITEENCKVEMAFFEDSNNRTFERTYGWAWLFQLHGALAQWQDPDAQRWAKILEPLANKLVSRYQEYLPKLVYPIRTGTHDNTAFGLSLSLEYARQQNLKEFESLIISTSKRLYEKDSNCNLAFEPSGHDFLSPCLEEARLMSKIMDVKEYNQWLKQFLPALYDPSFSLEVAKVSDRTDGHLVHLDGLNFSRATCLSDIAKKLPELKYLSAIGHQHFNASFGNITNDDYMGSHWLGTFALYTLIHQ
ncbi:MAG: DUF2891 domain-containing protein [Flavobacteriaceae bacterium]|jgi:hypothetical protein|nr:DUF2891 domain-containing protein [Flavobacteriaceae bacterium]